MKNFIALFSVVMFSANLWGMVVDTKASQIVWTGAKKIGDTHTGTVKIKSADIKWDKEEPIGGEVVIDMNTIANTDVKNAKFKKKLEDHLKSDDFFAVKKFGTAKFSITKVKKTSANKYILMGDLTIKGETHPATAKADVVPQGKAGKSVTVDMVFDRTKYNVRYGSGKFFDNLGDKIINDEINLKANIRLNNKS